MQSIQNRPAKHLLPPLLSALLPPTLLDAINRFGFPYAEELRLHKDRVSTVSVGGNNHPIPYRPSAQEMQELLMKLCNGSLYAYRESICQGYVSLSCGIRVGVCGSAAIEADRVIGVSAVTGLIIRIPHRVPVDAAPILTCLNKDKNRRGVLIFSPPGIGKTTLLRAVAETASRIEGGKRTVVVDTREELAYTLEGERLMLDVLSGYPRRLGIEIAVRSLGAELIICDEIGNEEDVQAILSAANSGVPLVASAHAESHQGLLSRCGMRELHRAHVFGSYVKLSRIGHQFSYEIKPWEAL